VRSWREKNKVPRLIYIRNIGTKYMLKQLTETKKTNLIELTYAELEAFLQNYSLPITIQGNIYKDIHKRNILDIDKLNLKVERKTSLKEVAYVPKLVLQKKQISSQGNTIKYLFRLPDNLFIETVLLLFGDKTTLCISSQCGCALSCGFCATGLMGFKRDLSVWEILSQVYVVSNDYGKKINNIVYMGMGEPMLNYDNMIKSASILNSNNGMNISSQKISISTVGIVPMIRRFIDENQPYHLILSLHSAIQEKREQIMPIAKRYSIEELASIIDLYYKKRKDWITIAYMMLSRFNMSNIDAEALKKLLYKLKCKLNLIPYNEIENIHSYKSPNKEEIAKFCDNFKDLNIPINIRKTMGKDINGACGQLYVELIKNY
jgi:23S rRNA (adenine2503-C2)-methyltransferase